MTVALKEEDNGKLLIVTLSGKLIAEDYEHLGPEFERLVKEHGKLNVVVFMHGFHGWTLGALWDDIKFEFKHFAHIKRLAMVGERKWEAGMAVFCKPFTTAKIRYFDVAAADEALAWARESTEPKPSA